MTKKTTRLIGVAVIIAALFFWLGWQTRQHSGGRIVPNNPSTVSNVLHAIGAVVDLPNGFDSKWLTPGYMTHSGVDKVSVLKVAVSGSQSSILMTGGPKSYEVDVLTRVCSNALGFKAARGSHSADIADAVSQYLLLIPQVQRGINGFYFGTMEISDAGTPPTLIHQRLMTLAPTMKPHQCFVGVVTYAVPAQIGSPGNLTRYSVVLTNRPWSPGNLQSIWWSSGD